MLENSELVNNFDASSYQISYYYVIGLSLIKVQRELCYDLFYVLSYAMSYFV